MIKRAKLTLVNKEKLPDGTILHKYERDDKTSFYHKIDNQNGEHEFGGEVCSKDIRDVESLTGKTLNKNQVSIIVKRRTPSILSAKIHLNMENPTIRLSLKEFQEFEEMLQSGWDYNRAFDVMRARQIRQQLESKRPVNPLNLNPQLKVNGLSYRLPSGTDIAEVIFSLQNERGEL